MYQRSCEGVHTAPKPPSRHRNRWTRLRAITSNVCLALAVSSCGSSDPTGSTETGSTAPSATPIPTQTPTPAASQYAGSWRFTIWLTAVAPQCGHTDSDIDVRTGPIPVTVAANGSFNVPSPVNASGTIDSAGDIRVSFAERTTCPAGNGAGGCVNVNHCDGTSVQAGDVSKWTLVRP
jgi:hypothetical protein